MKATKWQRTVSLLLCLLMAMSFLVITAPEAYAAEPDWPYLESIDEYVFENKNLNSDFPAAEDNLKKMEIQQANSLTECDVATDGATKTYHVGTIALYVEKFPTAADSTAKSYGFTFNIPKEGTGSAVKSKVTLKNTGENYTEVFYGKAMLYASFKFQQHDEWSYYIMTEDKVAYHYDVQVLQYTGESEDKPEPTWPYLESIDEYAFENKNLNSDFPAAEDNLKKMEIQQANSLTECDVATDGATKTYHVGTIALYVEKFPTAADSTAKSYGFTFNIPKEGTGSAVKSKVTLKNTGENYTEVFYGKAMLYASFKFQQHDEWSYYIMTEDKVAYHYDVQVLQYTGESGEELTLSNGSAKRTDKETATVTFNASSTGNYYYALCDEQQTTPAVDTSPANTNTGTMAKTNTITISGITNYKAKYLYIVGIDAAGKTSAPLEIVIPGITFALKHEKKSIYLVSLYTEQFTDIEGNPITAATPGDTVIVNFGVFEAGNEKVIYEDGAIKHKADVRQTVLKQWDITGLTLDPAPTGSSFRFTMPGNEVTIQAETKLAGVPIQLTSNMPTVKPVLRASAYFTNPYDIPGGNVGYSIIICNNQNRTDVIPAGTKVKLSVTSIPAAYVLDKWEITNNGTSVDEREITPNGDGSAEFTLAEGGDYVFTAVLRAKKFASVTAAVNDSTMGSATVTVDGNQQAVYEGQNVILTATPGSRYMLERWEVKDAAGNAIDTTAVEGDANKATFVMPSTDSAITATAFFKVDPEQASTENALTAVELDVPGAAVSRSGSTFTITLPAGTNTSKLGEKILKLTISDFATVTKEGDPDKDWTEGAACGMELDKAATFTVTAEKGNTQTYTIIITKAKSSEKDITAAVLLNQTGDTTPFARAEISETEITFTLPSDTDKAVLNSIGMKYLKLTYPESATVKMKDGYDDATNGGYRWSNGDVMCNMSINSPVKFTVTAEDSSTKEYTIEIKYTAPAAPTLSDGSATRSSKTGATVKFTSSEAGNYFYKVVDHGAAVPTVDTSKSGTAAVKGENTITLSNLTEDARDIYIVVVGAAGGESAALKVEIPAYGSGTDTPDTGAYKISISAPKGGTITTNRTKADKGDEIIVTVTPDNGYQMVSGSLTYTLATKGGETKTISNGRFTMPAGDVSITCKWETATTTAKGITSFSINGIAGAVNNTTNTITITMPRGTDVTKLTPTISTNGVKSITPGSGETVNFTNSVNYTATMEDGSTKTYTVTVYVEKGTLSDQFWDKLTDFVNQIPWWEYAKHQQSTSSYPKYW